jgi:hypothetical protein
MLNVHCHKIEMFPVLGKVKGKEIPAREEPG